MNRGISLKHSIAAGLWAASFVLVFLFTETSLHAFTANKVWMEFRPNGRYRVYVNYTVPALREFREVYTEFSKKKEAEKYYFDLVRGVDFYLPDAKDRKFVNQKNEPDPW